MTYPTSEDYKISKLSNILIKYSELKGFKFSFGGSELYPVEALSDFGGLSIFLANTKIIYDQLFSSRYSYEDLMGSLRSDKIKLSDTQRNLDFQYLKNFSSNFPITFIEKEEGTFFGFIPTFDQSIATSFSLMAHLSLYSLDECIRLAKLNKLVNEKNEIPLDHLYDEMIESISKNQIVILPSSSMELSLKTNN